MMDYQLRKDFIAKVLCINRSKPKLHCDGKCYLAKQLKLEEERENKALKKWWIMDPRKLST